LSRVCGSVEWICVELSAVARIRIVTREVDVFPARRTTG
jgi:hypothetical protein